MDAFEEGLQPRPAGIESGARGRGFQRKTQRDIGDAERLAAEPRVLAQFAFEVAQVTIMG